MSTYTVFEKIVSFFWPQVLYRGNSQYNKDIEVVLLFGKPSIRIGGLTQSGGLVTRLWQKWLRSVSRSYFTDNDPERILLLGLGGGTLVRVLQHYWPRAHITAVEIDPEVIRLGKKYLGLDVSTIEVIQADVQTWITRSGSPMQARYTASSKMTRDEQKYDLVIIDLYQGMDGPDWLDSKRFLHTLRNRMHARGVLLVNRGTFEKHDLSRFEDRLRGVFGEFETFATRFNKLYVMH